MSSNDSLSWMKDKAFDIMGTVKQSGGTVLNGKFAAKPAAPSPRNPSPAPPARSEPAPPRQAPVPQQAAPAPQYTPAPAPAPVQATQLFSLSPTSDPKDPGQEPEPLSLSGQNGSANAAESGDMLGLLGDFLTNPAPAPKNDDFSDWLTGANSAQAPAPAAPAANSNAMDQFSEFLAPSPAQAAKPPPRPTRPGAKDATRDMLDMKESTMMDFKDAPDFSEFQIEKEIGSGAFAQVFSCQWRGTQVAMKQILPERINKQNMDDFKREVQILSRLRHPNVVLEMAASVDPPHIFLVTEYCPQGTLFSILHQSKVQLDTNRKISIASDVARALAYLHGFRPAIIHRDVKSLNVLVDRNFNCKLSDFGLAISSYETTSQKCGTYQYMAPELFSGNVHYNEKVDVYAYGIFLWELFARELPYAGMLGEQVPLAVERGHRPSIPEGCPPFMSALMKQCWNGEPHARPSMVEVVASLKQVTDRMGDMWHL